MSDLARAIASGLPRRMLMRTLSGFGLSGLLLIAFNERDVNAKKRKRKKKKKCKAPTQKCGKRCRSVLTDPQNCGACGTVCASGEICVIGLCLTPCDNPSSSIPLTSCPADPGGICVTVDGTAVCILQDPPDVSCFPFARESCDDLPCPDGRVCANLVCGSDQFMCVLPALGNV